MDLPDIDAVQAQMQQLRLPVSASELHGAMAGWIAGGGDQTANWLSAVLADPEQAPVPADSALAAAFHATATQFHQREFGLAMLLPYDQATLADRSEGLFDWCRGFLGAFGLAAGAHPPLSDDAKEGLADLARLAAAQSQDDGDEEDEEALVEIEEYVRVVAMLLHADCASAAVPPEQLH